MGGLALTCWLAGGMFVYAQEPIVQPGDISTPTPTPLPTPLALPTPTPGPQALVEPAVSTELTPVQGSDLGPHLDVPAVSPVGMDASAGYSIRPGDTLFTVALEMGLDLNDVPCAIAPDFTVEQPLVIGNRLSIPPANIACHTVVAGETLASIAEQYGSSAGADLPAAVEQVGQG